MNMTFKSFIILLFFCLSFVNYGKVKIIIKFKIKIPEKVLADSANHNEIKVVKLNYFNNILGKKYAKIVVNNREKAKKIISRLKKNPDVIDAFIEHKLQIEHLPNDELLREQWSLKAIDAYSAWEITKGSQKIKIGLIDTGVKLEHPDLLGQFAINRAEDLNKNGIFDKYDIDNIDNDGNGFVDDVCGWNFIDGKNNIVEDDNGHGTFIAGILSAKQNNEIGISGVAPNCKILPLKAFNSNGYGNEEDVAKAILYAVNNGVRVINMSFGDTSYSTLLKDAIEFAYEKGVVMVASSGNTGNDVLHYPSAYQQTISVGAVNKYLNRAPFSSYGSNLDLVAPGVNVLTTSKDGGYKRISGTSAAAPFVTASVALLLSKSPNLTNEEIKQILKKSSQDIGELGWDEETGSGLLNVFNALTNIVPTVTKILSPGQNQGFFADSIDVVVSVISPYLKNFAIYLGKGSTPETWEKLGEFNRSVFAKKIFSIDMRNREDTIYTLRLKTNEDFNQTNEERINFFYDKSPPKIIANVPSKVLIGNKSTVFAELKTDDLSKASICFKAESENSYRSVELDDFENGIGKIKRYHFGCIPLNISGNTKNYDVFLKAENLSGLTSTFGDSLRPIEITLNSNFELRDKYFLKKKLPLGNLFESEISDKNSNKYLLFQEDKEGKNLTYKFIKYQDDEFVTVDSIVNTIPIYVGMNKADSLLYIVGNYQRKGIIWEQANSDSMHFNIKYADSSGDFYPVTVFDLDDNGENEIICNSNDEKYLIYSLDNNLNITLKKELLISENRRYYDVKAKVNNNIKAMQIGGETFLFVLTPQGYLNIYKVSKDLTFNLMEREDLTFRPNFSNALSLFNKGAKLDVAYLLNSNNSANYYLLKVFVFDKYHLQPLYREFFFNNKEINGFFNKDYSKISFFKLNNSMECLLINAYDYFYILNLNNRKYIYFDNSQLQNSFFVGNLNGTNSFIANAKNDSLEFFSFVENVTVSAPYNLIAYETENNDAYLNWQGEGSNFFIYRGINDSLNLTLTDSTTNNFYSEKIKYFGDTVYYYRIRAFDSHLGKFSSFSKIVGIKAERMSEYGLIGAKALGSKTLRLSFSGKVNYAPGKFNYSVKLNGRNEKPLISFETDTSYILYFEKDFLQGNNQIEISNFRNVFNGIIPSSETNFEYFPAVENKDYLFIEKYEFLGEKSFAIKFNLPLDSASAMNKNNYSIEPENRIKTINFYRKDLSTVKITLENTIGAIGINYVLHVKNIFSDKSTGKVKITGGAGSFVSLKEEIKDLSKVFVYPNPILLNKNNVLKFAKLPRNCEIEIFSINGEHIVRLENSTGTTSLKWNLRNENGNLISSGVYLYKVIEKDESGNQKNTILKKFAVIK